MSAAGKDFKVDVTTPLDEAMANGNDGVLYIPEGSDSIVFGGKRFVSTPSGDPMHYAYVAMGAVYNDTGEDIVYDESVDYTLSSYKSKKPYFLDWGDSYTHKAGCWLMNEVGDLTNADVRTIFMLRPPHRPSDSASQYFTGNARTNKPSQALYNVSNVNFTNFCANTMKMETIKICTNQSVKVLVGNLSWAFTPSGVTKILNDLHINACAYTTNAFYLSNSLVYVKFTGLAKNINIPCPKLHKQSVKWMIENETGEGEKVIELHPMSMR